MTSELIGFLLPPIIDIVNSKVSNAKLRLGISIGISFILGAIFVYADGNLKISSINDVFLTGSAIFVSAHAAYKLYWEKSDIRFDMFGNNLKNR